VSYLPNIKSAAKRDALSKAQNLINKSKKSALKTTVKKFDTAVADGNKEAASAAYTAAVKSIDHASGDRLLHKNNAARKKSRLAKALNTMAE
jgi:small subunit ribosomal protein S20